MIEDTDMSEFEAEFTDAKATPEDVLLGVGRRAASMLDGVPGIIVGVGDSFVRIALAQPTQDIAPDPEFWMDPLAGMDYVDCGIAETASDLARTLAEASEALMKVAEDHFNSHHGDDPTGVIV